MTEHQYEQATSIQYDIGIREHHIAKINEQIKKIKEMEDKNCECYMKVIGEYSGDVEFSLYPLSKKIMEVIVEQLTERKTEYQKEIKELKEKFKKI